MRALPVLTLTALACTAVASAQAQSNVKPPEAQAWIDIATYSGMGMPMGMGGMGGGGGGNPLSALGGLFGGGGSGGNRFGHTQDGAGGRWMDVTLYSRANASLAEAQQAVPPGFLSPALTLQAPKEAKPQPAPDREDTPDEPTYEKPKGKLYLYWGCGETVRAGQPRVLDVATATPADFAKFFTGRRATQRGTHLGAGRPVWPSQKDTRMVPEKASLVGEHQFTGAGLPDGFKFSIPAAQDLMPAIALQQTDAGGATQLSWNAIPTARAYFAAAMGSKGGENEMVIWTSSEQPDTGFGLMDYQTNAAVDRWLGEKVLMKPSQTSCAIPKGVFGAGQGGGFLRVIAYGSELNLAHPPRPADPKAAWEPVWAAKLRVKSVASAVLGMSGGSDLSNMPRPSPQGGDPDQPPKQADKPATPNPIDILRGVLGR